MALAISLARVRAGSPRYAGAASINSAAMPATAGDAELVPEASWYSPRLPPPAGDRMDTPVATICGASRPSAVGPRLLKSASAPLSRTAPTDSEFFAAAMFEKAKSASLPCATT